MIADLLPRYYELVGDDLQYTILQSYMSEDHLGPTHSKHEVAWMEFTGTYVYDLMGLGREGTTFTGRTLHCECDFTEGVDFKIEDGRRIGLGGARTCPHREPVVRLRHLELHFEYVVRFGVDNESLVDHFEEIVFDLIEKVKAGEFLEDGNGASFWGGYFYLQTVASIVDHPLPELWILVAKMVKDKKIDLDGAVIKPYREPPPAAWEETFRLDVDGWVGISALPMHRNMLQAWELTILNPNGKEVAKEYLELTHRPDFGPDIGDIAAAEEKLHELITSARTRG